MDYVTQNAHVVHSKVGDCDVFVCMAHTHYLKCVMCLTDENDTIPTFEWATCAFCVTLGTPAAEPQAGKRPLSITLIPRVSPRTD
jgi:hypothetical protein